MVSTVCTPEITPLAWSGWKDFDHRHIDSQIFNEISFLLKVLVHLFCGDVVHCLLVAPPTKWSERKVPCCHVVEGHLIYVICEGLFSSIKKELDNMGCTHHYQYW